MKTWVKTSALGLTVAIILCLAARAQLNSLIQGTLTPAQDSIVQITADAMGLESVAYADLPRGGTYWWVEPSGVMAPLPCPPQNRVVPIYAITDNQFLVDDTGGQVALNTRRLNLTQATTSSLTVSAVDRLGNAVADLIEQIQQTQFERNMIMSLGLDVPSPGEGGGGTNGGNGGGSSTYTIDTNLLWLEITNVSNGWSHLNLHSGTNQFTNSQVFAILTKTNLLDATWNTETFVSPTSDQTNVMPFSVQNFDRPILFFKVQDWTGVDSNTNGLPDWWEWKYFGGYNQNATNLDSGKINTLLNDYQNRHDPNIIHYALNLPLGPVTSNSVNGTISILGGVPSYMAVLVNDTNLANAVWQPYTSSNVVVNLNSQNGLYKVLVGLRGLPADAQETWQSGHVTLYSVPLTLAIESPASGTISQPMIQLQGFASRILGSLTYDVSNPAGIFTNQTGYVTGSYYDTNLLAYTASFFQGYDVALATGVNTITVHATDMAGNTASTNISVTVDYSGDTTAPVLSGVWPEDETYICGNQFTFAAQVDDVTAKVTATIVDADGHTNSVPGVIERSGLVWVQNLPLAAGANTLTVTARDAAGNVAVTSRTLYQSSVLVTLTPPTGDLNTVYGTVSDATARVFVNEVQATVYEDGTWTASGVPVNTGGTARYNVVVYPAADEPPGGGGDGGGGTRPTLTRPLTASSLPSDKPPLGFDVFNASGSPTTQVVSFQKATSGVGVHFIDYEGYAIRWAVQDYVAEVEWDEGWGGRSDTAGVITEWYYDYWLPPQSYATHNPLPSDWPGASSISFMPSAHGTIGDTSWSGAVDAKTVLKTGGTAVMGQTNLYLVKVQVQDGSGTSVPPSQVQLSDWMLTPDATDTNWGDYLVTAPSGATVPMTPTAPPSYYAWGFQVAQVNLQPAVDANRDGDITFDIPNQTNPDKTSSTNYYRFWVNDDQDDLNSSESVPVTAPDYANNQIKTIRDLEDFARLNILVQGITNEIADGTFRVGVKWKNTTGTPAVKLFRNLSPNGDMEYLTDTNVATQFLSLTAPGYVAGTGTYLIPTNFWQDVGINTTNSTGWIIFEGCSVGKGQLVLTINKPDGTELAEAGSVWLDLKDIKTMYQRYDGSGQNQWPSTTFDQDPNENQEAIVFVHGWRMSPDSASEFAETMFKRMWQRGYKGRFAAFRWNTYWSDTFGWLPYAGTAYDSYLADFNGSESNAWAAGGALKNFVDTLPAGYTKNIAAHSMGNIVAGSALLSGMTIDNYALLQAAVPACCYDDSVSLQQTQPYTHYDSWWHPGITVWDQLSPDNDPDAATRALSYRGRLKNVQGNLVSFCLTNDYATCAAWEVNNEIAKPPGYLTTSGYHYYPNNDAGYRLYKSTGAPDYGYYLTNAFEAMPYACRSWSKAAGAELNTHGSISGTVDLSSAAYNLPGQPDGSGFYDQHSAEFNYPIQNLKQFYTDLLEKLHTSYNP